MSLPTLENAILQFQAGKSDERLVFWSLVSGEPDDHARDEAEALLVRQLAERREVSDDEARLLLNEAVVEGRSDDDPQSLWESVLDGSWVPAEG